VLSWRERHENFQLAISIQRRAGITRWPMIGSFRRDIRDRSFATRLRPLGGIHYAPTSAARCTLRVHSCAYACASAFVSTGVILEVIHLSRYALNGISILLDTPACDTYCLWLPNAYNIDSTCLFAFSFSSFFFPFLCHMSIGMDES